MFRLRKVYPPFGSVDNPLIESSYSEGLITVVDGLCEVRLPETRDRLLKIGYEEVMEQAEDEESTAQEPAGQVARRGSGRRR